MSVRLPLQTVLDFNDAADVGAGSVSGGVAKSFFIPQDTDNMVLKLTASITGGGVSATIQTTDDGGTTWYDLGRTSIVSNANATTAQWLSFPVIGSGTSTTIQTAITGSAMGAVSSIEQAIGSAAASTLAQLSMSGLPILSPLNRVFLIYTAGVSANALARVQVKVNSQSARA